MKDGSSKTDGKKRDPKKNCKRCYGRGYQSYLVGDGYHVVDGLREPNDEREKRPCKCVLS